MELRENISERIQILLNVGMVALVSDHSDQKFSTETVLSQLIMM